MLACMHYHYIVYPCTFILQYVDKNYELKHSTQIPFQFEDTDGSIELCFDAKDREERQATDARQREEITDCSTKGWSIRPHQTPTKVSSYNYTCNCISLHDRSVRILSTVLLLLISLND